MPISYIDGSYYFPEEHSYVAPLSFGVGALSDSRARLALEARGATNYISRATMAAGDAVEGSGEMALDAGAPVRGVAEQMLALTGFVYASYGASMFLTVAPPPTVFVGRMSADVITSRLSSAVGRMGLIARGLTQGHHFPHSLLIRQEAEARARQSLSLRSFANNVARIALLTGTEHNVVSRVSADVVKSDGFVVLADIVGATLYDSGDVTPAGYIPMQDINARLLVNGVEVLIRSFSYQEPKGRLGASLNCVLADAVPVGLAPVNANITFQLILTDVDGVDHYVTLVNAGKIGGRNFTAQWSGRGPGDELSVAGLDTLADKFSLGLRQPVIMFDPEKVKVSDVEVKVRDAVVAGSADDRFGHTKGTPILPTLEPVENLTMMAGVRRAYTGATGNQFMTRMQPGSLARLSPRMQNLIGRGSLYSKGLDFASVITNIPDYPVSRVDFSLESTWHDAVQPLVGMYGPIYFVQTNILFIMDARRALPAGHIARICRIDDYSVLTRSEPYRDPYNAVIVTYQENGAEDVGFREVTETTYSQEGTFGTLSYEKTEEVVTTREKFLLSDPNSVLETLEVRHDVKKYGHLPILEVASGGGDHVYSGSIPGPITQISRDFTQTFYNSEGLKSGHSKEVYGLMFVGPDASVEPTKLMTEKCEISWAQHPEDPAQMIQLRNFTFCEGLMYESTRTESRLDPAGGGKKDVRVRYPVIAAQSSPGIIKDDDGVVYFGPIRSITESLRRGRGNQLDVLVQERDLCWSGTCRDSHTAPRVGSRSTNPYEARSRHVLLRDETSESEIGPRPPVGVSAGELPRDRAMELGQRYLKEGIMGQLPQISVSLPGMDFALRQGSVVRGEWPDGTLTNPFIVEGRTITGNGLGQSGQHRISMSLEGTELA